MIEVERKFVVCSPPNNIESYPHYDIEQGYMVVGEEGEARLRRMDNTHALTVKSKGDLARGEWEVRITKSQFEELWPSTKGKRVMKTRYRIPIGESDSLVAELDIYAGKLASLMTVEVEFPDEEVAASFVAPEWFDIEVTEDPSYKNQRLAVWGLPYIG